MKIKFNSSPFFCFAKNRLADYGSVLADAYNNDYIQLIWHVSSLVNKYDEMINNPTDTIWISNPYNGKLPKEAVIPNNPKTAGNNPTKHPGHAPPNTPPKAPRAVNPDPLFNCLRVLILVYDKFTLAATSKETKRLKNTKKTIKNE